MSAPPRPSSPPPLDDYERKYMGGDALLARSRIASPWWMNALFALSAVGVLASGISALPQTIVPLLLFPFVAFLGIFLLFLRIAVTPAHVHIQYGLAGPKIPIEAIRDARVVAYDWAAYGGWGIRRRPGAGWAYSVPGHGGRGVKLTYVTKKGSEQTVFASSDRPEEIVAAIERAREASRATSARAARSRVGSDGSRGAGPRIVDEEFAEGEADGERAGGEATRAGRSP